MLEIIYLCVALECPQMYDNPDWHRMAVGLPPRTRLSSDHLSPSGGWLKAFCFINRTDESGYLRVIEWTDRVVRIEASEGIETCNPRFMRRGQS